MKRLLALFALLLSVNLAAAQTVGCPSGNGQSVTFNGRVGQTLTLATYPYNVGVPDHIAATQAWLGEPVDSILTFLNYSSWTALKSSATIIPTAPSGMAYIIGLPLTVGSGGTASTSLASVATGSNDADFTTAMNSVIAIQPTGPIIVRLGWEMNGNFYPWMGFGFETDYIAAFRHVSTLIKGLSPRIVVNWNTNRTTYNNSTPIDPSTMYPGDSYVDQIGQDVYFDITFDGTAANAWNTALQGETYDLTWIAGFALTHLKPLTIPEWGVNTDTYASIVPLMSNWMYTNNVIFTGYWDSNSTFSGQLSNNQYPNASANFIAAYGPPNFTSSASQSVNVGSALSVALATNHSAKMALASCVSPPPSGTNVFGGSTLYMPAQGSTGTQTINLKSYDSRGNKAAQAITVTVH